MIGLPISLCFFTSTRGHWGRRDDWLTTLKHWDRQYPLIGFNLIAHIKASPSEEAIGDIMRDQLEKLGFKVFVTNGAWSRGLSHGFSYLCDQIRMSKEPALYTRPYFLLVEDDTPVRANGAASLESLLLQSCQLLQDNHELVTVRTIRRGDYDGGVPQLADAENGHAFYSPYTDYQTMLLRSIDFYRLCMVLDANPEACNTVQCEALWATILNGFSRNPHKHLVWKPEWAEALHIGVEHPEAELAKL